MPSTYGCIELVPFVVSNATADSVGFGIVNLTLAGGLILSICLSAMFSSGETAVLSVPDHRVEVLVAETVHRAEDLATLKRDPHRQRMTLVLGNILVNVSAVSISTVLWARHVSPGAAIALTVVGVTPILYAFGQHVPRIYAEENPESWALTVARPLRFAGLVLHPFIVVLEYIENISGREAVESTPTARDKLRELVETGGREGVIDEAERELLQRILRFDDTIAKEAMTPRLDIVGVPERATVGEAFRASIDSGHSRLPVYADDLDAVVGMVTLRDLSRARISTGENAPSGELDALVRPIRHIPESKRVAELLTELQEARTQMAIVIDEFGTTEGLITVEDLAEEIVGDILDVDEAESIEIVDERTALVRGDTNVEDVNEALGLDLPEGEEFETIAGFIFNRVGRLVERGETFSYDGARLRIERVEMPRILRVRITTDSDASGEDSIGAPEITDG